MCRASFRWLVLIVLVGCGQATQSRTPPPDGGAASATTVPPTAPVGPTPAPVARWQPPIPTPHGQPLPLPTAVPGIEVVRLTLAGVTAFTLSLRDTGLATLTEGEQRITLTLALTEHTRLLTLVADTPIETMAPAYIESFPAGAIVDLPTRTVTIPGRGTVELFADGRAPADLIALEHRLDALADRVRRDGGHPPAPVLSYVLTTATTIARLDLDRQGTIRMDQQVVGTLSPAEWAALSAMVSPQAFAPWADSYDLPDDQRNDQAWEATIISYPPGEEWYAVSIDTGTAIPPDLRALVTRLTDIYRRYAPPQE